MNAGMRKYWNRKRVVFDKYGGRCAYCGEEISFDNFQIDHIVSKVSHKYRGVNVDLESLENLNPSCCSCNNYKRDNSVEQFLEDIEFQVFRLRRDKPTFNLAERYCQITCHPRKVIFYFENTVQDA